MCFLSSVLYQIQSKCILAVMTGRDPPQRATPTTSLSGPSQVVYCDTCTRVRGAGIKQNSLPVVKFWRQSGSSKRQQRFFHSLCVVLCSCCARSGSLNYLLVLHSTSTFTHRVMRRSPPSPHLHDNPSSTRDDRGHRSPTRSLSQNLISGSPESMSPSLDRP